MQTHFRFYKIVVSPFLHFFSRTIGGNPHLGCKFEPTCSSYCDEAIEKYGVIRGGKKALLRVLKCNPLSRSGGYDPV